MYFEVILPVIEPSLGVADVVKVIALFYSPVWECHMPYVRRCISSHVWNLCDDIISSASIQVAPPTQPESSQGTVNQPHVTNQEMQGVPYRKPMQPWQWFCLHCEGVPHSMHTNYILVMLGSKAFIDDVELETVCIHTLC